MKVAVLGKSGSFHHTVAKQLYGEALNAIHVDSFPQLLDKVKRGQSVAGIIAIENNTAGSLMDNYLELHRSGLQIVDECYQKIELALITKTQLDIDQISHLHSHPMAFLQCKAFISSLNMPTLSACNDTSTAVKKVKRNNSLQHAAIAHATLASQHDLFVLQNGIETNKNNYTRFFVVQQSQSGGAMNNKCTLCFSLPHESGSLASLLMRLANEHYNLSKIQSFPVTGKINRYLFYVDIEYPVGGNRTELEKLIHPCVNDLHILGEYKKFQIELN